MQVKILLPIQRIADEGIQFAVKSANIYVQIG
jgi:hypothetical protein